MTSILEVEQLDTLSSNASSTLTIGGTNTTTIAFGPNVTTTPSSLANTPAFFAYATGTQQSISDETVTKLEFNTEEYDTNGDYDNSTNYRFTPSVAGKYLVYGSVGLSASNGANTDISSAFIYAYKNGSEVHRVQHNPTASYMRRVPVYITFSITMNGSTDYLELFGRANSQSNQSIVVLNGTNSFTSFGAYKIIGA